MNEIKVPEERGESFANSISEYDIQVNHVNVEAEKVEK